jgi:hypothetical protein
MRYLPFLFAAAFATSCCNRCNDTSMTRYHEDGRAKPVAAMPAIIDTSSFDAPWSISEEMTSTIVKMISRSGKIFLQSQDDFAIASNPFTNGDFSWMKREFQNQEFAVFLELVEHEFTPSRNSPNSNNLKIGVRVRVIDLRGSNPKIVLQEMISESYFIPKTLIPVDYNIVTWGTEDYENSPMRMAHTQIAQEVASRISEYILLAKSR